MQPSHLRVLLDRLCSLPGAAESNDLSDADLLERFRARQEEAAGALLIQRHGAMVLGVCRRILGNAHDAEDAFQATFLVLVRQAGSIRKGSSLGSWLHGVALRVARRARAAAAVRRDREREVIAMTPPADPADELARSELCAALDDEMHKLPEKYRAALILCYLEDKTHAQAAQELRWTKSSVTARVNRGRELLQQRLARRGFAVTGTLLAVFLAEEATAGTVSAALTLSAVGLAVQTLTGRAAASPAVALADSFSRGAPMLRRIAVLALIVAVGLAGAVVTLLASPAPEPARSEPPPAPPNEVTLKAPAVPLPKGALLRIGNARMGHSGWPYRVVYSSNGKLLATAGEDKLARLWDTAAGREGRKFSVKDGAVYSVAFAPDGKSLVAGGGDKLLHHWDVVTGEEIRTYRGHGGAILAVTFSPDGTMIASEGHDKTVRLWDIATGKESLRLPGHKSNGTSNVVFSPDGALLAAVGEDSSIGLWDVKSGARRVRFVGHGADAESLAFTPDGKVLVSGGLDNCVRYWDLATASETRTIKESVGWVYAVAVSPDGKLLATGGHDRGVRIFDLATGKERWLLGWHGYVKSVAFAPDSKSLAAGDSYGVVRLWNVETGLELPQSGELVTSVALSANGAVLATGCRDHIVRLWNPRTGKPLGELRGHDKPVTAVAVSPDGQLVVSESSAVGAPTILHVWDRTASEPLRKKIPLPRGHNNLAFSPDGRTFSVEGGRSPAAVKLWDSASGKEIHTMGCSWTGDRASAFSSSGRLLATLHEDKERGVRLHDVASGNESRYICLPRVAPVCATFSPDDRTVALADRDGCILLLEAATGGERGRLAGTEGACGLVGFLANGRVLAWSDEWSERLTDVATGRELRSFAGHKGEVKETAITADGSLLVSRGGDATAIVWSAVGLGQDSPARDRTHPDEILNGLWEDLAGKQADRAYRAMWALIESPRQSVALLRRRVAPAGPLSKADADSFARLLADLDHEEFGRREKATEEMAKRGIAFEAAGRAEMDRGPASAEVRRRLAEVLQRIERSELPPDALQTLRAVEVLEQIGTAEARAVLAALAAGAADARLTREANAAAARLAKRQLTP